MQPTPEDLFGYGNVQTALLSQTGELAFSGHAPSSGARQKPRGRPPKPLDRHERELRVTPPNGVPVVNWDVAPRNEVSKLVVCEEGGEGTGKQLHYHLVIESTYSDEMIKSWVRKVLNLPTTTPLGNAVYRSGKPHEGTYGYVVKERDLKHNHGYTLEQYHQWCIDSDNYRQALAAERRQQQRLRSQSRAKQLRTIEDKVRDMLSTITAQPTAIIRAILEQCREHNVDWPTRTQMDSMVNRLRWDYSPDAKDAVVRYYANNFERLEYSQNVSW